jgi:dimethylhistidine N-methyltransferase
LRETLQGLAASPKRLSCKYFYDKRGSALFDRICELEEYYVTRTEQAIMDRNAAEMGEQIGPGAMLVEYGSGSSVKTRALLDHLPEPVAYVPVDISHRHLHATAESLRSDYSEFEILPVTADFTQPFSLPESENEPTHVAVYFPGSTIGNFEPPRAIEVLRSIANLCGPGGGLLIGVDLVKPAEVLERAYDDRQGVTAEFNLNLLRRLRDELGADLDLDGFEHHVVFNHSKSRIEIYIRSNRDQHIEIDGRRFRCSEGELLHTEYSHKYTVERFAEMAAEAGLSLHKHWTDDRNYFAVCHFVVEETDRK